jgi:signal transduction histidine kinase
LLEAYAGMTTASGRRVLVDLYEPYEVVLASDRAEWVSYAPVALGALVLLELVQVPLAWRQARRLRRSEDAELRLLQASVAAADRERRRIAADLHDTVVQDLTGLAYDLDAARLHGAGARTEAERVLGRTATRLRACIDELRGVLVSLRAPRAAPGGLAAALTALAAELEDAGLRVSVRVSGADRIPPPAAAVLHRAAQEALRNVRSHSGATSVELALRCQGDWATLVVEDDGRGFDATRLAERGASGHLGLRALGDLLAAAGGTLTASSAPGAGTRLALRIPLDPSPVGAPL